MNSKHLFFVVSLLASLMLTACRPAHCLTSPEGVLEVSFRLNSSGAPEYKVMRRGTPLLSWSAMGLRLTDCDLDSGFSLVSCDTASHDETWETVWGEERSIRNRYTQLTAHLRHGSGVQMDIVFRAFDDGVAFRYVFPNNTDSMVVLEEKTAYTFAREPQAWSIPWRTEYYEALWTRCPISEKDTTCSPVTLELAEGGYAFLHEAALTDYPAENFYYTGRTIRTFLTPGRTAWRHTNMVLGRRRGVCSWWRMTFLRWWHPV